MKYTRVIQDPQCCVPACIKMILLRYKLRQLSQEKIGYELGLTVSPEDKDIFNKVRVATSPDDLIGTQLHKKEYSLNDFFEKYSYPLKYEYHYIDEPNLIKGFLDENKDYDIIVCFEIKGIYTKGINKPNVIPSGGHVALIENFENNQLTLVDGWFDSCKIVSIEEIAKAIKVHGQKNAAGFWLIKKNEEINNDN